jgi:hypothetical protein
MAAATDDIDMVLGENGAKQRDPNPRGVRDRNSPVAPAMRPLRSHEGRCKAGRPRRQHRMTSPALPSGPSPAARSDRKSRPPVFNARSCNRQGGAIVAKRIVVTQTEARQATKEGVVRYVLMVSLALVVVLFAVAYVIFH